MAPGENLPENQRQVEFFSAFFWRILTPVLLPLSFNLLIVAYVATDSGALRDCLTDLPLKFDST